jgi:hypothetical protein
MRAALQLVFVLLEALVCSDPWPGGIVSNIDTAAAPILWLPDHAVLARDLARPVIIKNGRSIYVDSSGAVAFAMEATAPRFPTGLSGISPTPAGISDRPGN